MDFNPSLTDEYVRDVKALVHGEGLAMAFTIGAFVCDHERMRPTSLRDPVEPLEEEQERDLLRCVPVREARLVLGRRRARTGVVRALRHTRNTDQEAFRALDAVTSRSSLDGDTMPGDVSTLPARIARTRTDLQEAAASSALSLSAPASAGVQRPPVIRRSRCATPAVPYG